MVFRQWRRSRYGWRVALLCALLGWGLTARADMLDDIRTRHAIRVLMADGVPGFCYRVGKDYVGSDADTARLLAKDLGVRLEIVPILHSARIDALEEGKADVIVSALAITPERERQVAFSVPYSHLATVIAAPASYHLYSMQSLHGLKIGVVANTSNEAHLRQQVPDVEIVKYVNDTALAKGYAAGEVDVVSVVDSLLPEIARQAPKRPPLRQFVQMEFDIAVGLPRNEKRLREWVNGWVVANLRNGRLDAIYRKHHGQDLPASVLPHAQRK